MAWLGASIVVVTSLRYMLFTPASGAYQELFAVSAEAPPPTMVQAIPTAHLALLLMVCAPPLTLAALACHTPARMADDALLHAAHHHPSPHCMAPLEASQRPHSGTKFCRIRWAS